MKNDEVSRESNAKASQQSLYRMRPSVAPQIDEIMGNQKPAAVTGETWDDRPEVGFQPGMWVVFGLLAAMFAGGIIYFSRATMSEAEANLAPVTVVDEKSVGWQGPQPRQVADNFIAATSLEERLKWVRDPDQVEPLLRDFYESGPGSQEKILGMKPYPSVSNEKFVIDRYEVILENGRNRLLFVAHINQRAYVDFKSYIRYNSASWEDLLSGKKTEADEVRVSIQKEHFYLGEFSDEKRWQCFAVQSLDHDGPLYFYVERDSEMGIKLNGIKDYLFSRVTLGIRSVHQSYEKKQFEITQIHSSSWCF